MSTIYTLAHSKTNQTGAVRPEEVKPLVGSAAQAMAEWLAASGIQEGALSRRIRKGGIWGEPLARAAVRDIVKERCALAGVEGKFSAHSLRAGFVTEAGRQAMSLPETSPVVTHALRRGMDIQCIELFIILRNERSIENQSWC